ncbi:MAG: hypothetical protein AAGC64_04415, partial [Bacteroidota bacterium]
LAQAQDEELHKQHYLEAYQELQAMLNEEKPLSFKRAVYLTENAYLENSLDDAQFDEAIQYYVRLALSLEETGGLLYHEDDKDDVLKAASIFRALKDTVRIGDPADPKSYIKYPLTYDTQDFWGRQDWTKMFVSKLLSTGSGNCHSLPALYKILADELDVKELDYLIGKGYRLSKDGTQLIK